MSNVFFIVFDGAMNKFKILGSKLILSAQVSWCFKNRDKQEKYILHRFLQRYSELSMNLIRLHLTKVFYTNSMKKWLPLYKLFSLKKKVHETLKLI